MKKIYNATIHFDTSDNTYEMGEISECEYSDSWKGDVAGYIENLDIDSDYTMEGESALYNIRQQYGSHDPITGSIHVLIIDKQPAEIYWASEEEEEIMNKYNIQFEAGTGKHFPGGVNYLVAGPGADVTIYAECPVPDECSDDYGYLTMKNAIIKAFEKAGGDPGQLSFWYDGQEENLDPDAAADCEVYVDVDLG